METERTGRLADFIAWVGSNIHAVLASVFRTYRRQGRDILEAVVELLRHGPGHVLEFDHTAAPVPAP